MLCARCGGLLMQNWWDSKGSVQERMPSTRCVNCGCINDPVILANRRPLHRARITLTRDCTNSVKLSIPSPQGKM